MIAHDYFMTSMKKYSPHCRITKFKFSRKKQFKNMFSVFYKANKGKNLSIFIFFKCRIVNNDISEVSDIVDQRQY